MKDTRGWLRFAGIIVALVCTHFPNGARADHGEARLASFEEALARDGYCVTPGAAPAWNPAERWCNYDPAFPHAIFTNNAPYLMLQVPESAGGTEPRLVQDFQIERDEAIVLIGPTPPPAMYFGFYTFVAKKVYPDGEKRTIVSSVVDPVNNVATGKSTHMSINVYTGEEKDGKLSIGTVDDRSFAGTATPYLPPGAPAAKLMYAYKISRSCGDEPIACRCPPPTSSGIARA